MKSKKKSHLNKILIYVLGLYFGFILLALIVMAIVSTLTTIAPVPAADKDLVKKYQELATKIDGDWALMMAYDSVKTKNHLKKANPEDTALKFLIISIEKKNKDGDTVSVVNLRTTKAIAAYMDEPESTLSLDRVLAYFNDLNGPRCVIDYRGKDVKDLEDDLTDKELDILLDMTAGDIIEKAYGEKISLPAFIKTDAVGFFAHPAPEATRVSSPYGMRFHPRLKKFKFHSGIDLAGPNAFQSPVIAAADGIVLKAAVDVFGYGNFVVIKHLDREGKTWTTLYGHLDSVVVRKGMNVTRGTVIGALGSSGLSTGPHLHFEIRFNNQTIDPALFLNKTHRDYLNEPK